MSGKMVLLAIIVSRSEALVVASMLNAAGIIVDVGALQHASASINSLALGHYRLMVSDWQYDDASRIVAPTFARAEYRFCEGLQTAVVKLLLAKLFAGFGMIMLTALTPTSVVFWNFGLPFLLLLETEAPPQGRSDYFLSEKDRKDS